jgi:hypothetical protein
VLDAFQTATNSLFEAAADGAIRWEETGHGGEMVEQLTEHAAVFHLLSRRSCPPCRERLLDRLMAPNDFAEEGALGPVACLRWRWLTSHVLVKHSAPS